MTSFKSYITEYTKIISCINFYKNLLNCKKWLRQIKNVKISPIFANFVKLEIKNTDIRYKLGLYIKLHFNIHCLFKFFPTTHSIKQGHTFPLLPVWAVWQLTPFVGHQTTALTEGQVLNVNKIHLSKFLLKKKVHSI